MAEYQFIYVTCENGQQAETISVALVEEGLAACANIFPASNSIFIWEGKLQQVQETVILLKSRKSLFKKIHERVTELHSYDNPCVIAFDISEGSQAYIEWLGKQTRWSNL